MPQVIVITGIPEYPPEVKASEAITPGHLLDFVLAAGATQGQLRKHVDAANNRMCMFAVESLVPSLSNSQTSPIDIPYAIGDSVRWCVPRSGHVIYAWVPANAAAVVRGNLMSTNGDGTLIIFAAQTTGAIVVADENVNNSAVGVPARIRVRVI